MRDLHGVRHEFDLGEYRLADQWVRGKEPPPDQGDDQDTGDTAGDDLILSVF
jgi:hypothetical protein